MPFNSEYPFIRWVEKNGYSVGYWSGADTHRFGARLSEPSRRPKLFVSLGHDEYWSKGSVIFLLKTGAYCSDFESLFWSSGCFRCILSVLVNPNFPYFCCCISLLDLYFVEQRQHVSRAREVGTHIAFMSGNEMYWKIRWETSTFGNNHSSDGSEEASGDAEGDREAGSFRTIAIYKDSQSVQPLDPVEWTGTWRDNRPSNSFGSLPENEVPAYF
jgi:hypothetical protein